MTHTRDSCKFNFVPCSEIPILFAGNIMNVFALQSPYLVEQLEDKERENSKAQLGRWIKTGLIRNSAKDRQMSFVYPYFFLETH
jgi:hypothetical protein